MKKYGLISLLLLLFLSSVVYAESKFVWDLPTIGVPDGYVLYYGPENDKYLYHYNVGNVLECPIEVLNLIPGIKYFFVVRAYNEYGESGDSNEVNHMINNYLPIQDNKPTRIDIPGPSTIFIK